MFYEYLYCRSINNDEAVYPNPSKFDPSRHLTSDGQLAGSKKLTDSHIFGHGRRGVFTWMKECFIHTNNSELYRKCPGRYFADETIWLTIVYLLSTFDIKSSVSKDEETMEYLEGHT